ncbi:MAG TPA: hypothetical protein VIT91_09945 [Chthoniobacterales bacterium]
MSVARPKEFDQDAALNRAVELFRQRGFRGACVESFHAGIQFADDDDTGIGNLLTVMPWKIATSGPGDQQAMFPTS